MLWVVPMSLKQRIDRTEGLRVMYVLVLVVLLRIHHQRLLFE